MSAVAHSFSLSQKEPKMITLPKPVLDGTLSVEAAMHRRKSVRSYAAKALTIAEVSQLLWAAQGINRQNGMRTAPSAGALYPLEVYLVAGNVDDLPPGVYHYHPHKHALELITSGDLRPDLTRAALRQSCIENGAINLVLSAVYERTSIKYGSRAGRYVHMEIGHAAQNIYLQAAALDLGTVVVGAFDDERVQRTLMMKDNEAPLCIMPVGFPPEQAKK